MHHPRPALDGDVLLLETPMETIVANLACLTAFIKSMSLFSLHVKMLLYQHGLFSEFENCLWGLGGLADSRNSLS